MVSKPGWSGSGSLTIIAAAAIICTASHCQGWLAVHCESAVSHTNCCSGAGAGAASDKQLTIPSVAYQVTSKEAARSSKQQTGHYTHDKLSTGAGQPQQQGSSDSSVLMPPPIMPPVRPPPPALGVSQRFELAAIQGVQLPHLRQSGCRQSLHRLCTHKLSRR